ncbi:MAG: PIN domain-containing protein [Trueperaceae bacterium]|nr:PIN domain-containing protein [Trueperaceae bacterium]
MRILVDTNVVLDVLMARRPHVDHALAVFALVDSGRVRGVLGATTITTVFYLAAKGVGVTQARAHVRSLLDLFDVASVDRAVLVAALEAGFDDFEDGVLHEAAVVAGVDAIVSRDGAGFAAASLPVFTPSAFLAAVRGDPC